MFSFRDKVNQALDETNKPIFPNVQAATNDEITTELQLFEASGGAHKGNNLEYAYHSLLTIMSTSVESERAFSAAGYLCNERLQTGHLPRAHAHCADMWT